MPKAWSGKRERQYEHIKDQEKDRGESTKRAEEIAARTVNKERARKGESKTSSRLSKTDASSGHRGGKRSGTSGPRGRTKDQLYNEAKRRNIHRRSKMTEAELEKALGTKRVLRAASQLGGPVPTVRDGQRAARRGRS
jgi:hypothetical protein